MRWPMAFGGKLAENFARTTPELPWELDRELDWVRSKLSSFLSNTYRVILPQTAVVRLASPFGVRDLFNFL